MSADEQAQIKLDPENSLMGALRGKHQKLAASQEMTMSVPGYEDLLAVRYRVLDVQVEINDINRKTAREFSDPIVASLYSTMDAMSRACIELYGIRGDKQEPLAQSFGPDEPPVRYDERLAEFMGFVNVHSAREIILELFAGNEPMIVDHGILLNRWMTNTLRRVNDDFAGNL